MLDHYQFQHGQEIDGRFLIPGGHAPGVLEPTDATFNHIAPAISGRVEPWRAARPMPVGFTFFGDDRPDAAPPQPSAYPRNIVALVPRHTGGTAPRLAQRWRNPHRLQGGGYRRRFMGLPRRDPHRQRGAWTVSHHLDCGAPTAAAAAPCVIRRFLRTPFFFHRPPRTHGPARNCRRRTTGPHRCGLRHPSKSARPAASGRSIRPAATAHPSVRIVASLRTPVLRMSGAKMSIITTIRTYRTRPSLLRSGMHPRI